MKRNIVEQVKAFGVVSACALAGLPMTTMIPLPFTLLMTRRFKRERQLTQLHQMVAWGRFCMLQILGIKLDIVGKEHIPEKTAGYLFVSNHQSYVDIPVLVASLDTVAFLSKSLIKWFPVFGVCAYAGGSVFVKRSDQESRKQALDETIEMCKRSTAVIVFPEGTRSPDGNLRETIRPGAIRAAYDHGLQIIPVGIDGTRNVVPKTNDRIVRGQRVAVTIGKPMSPFDFESSELWVDAVWGRVKTLFAESRSRLSTET